MDETAEVLTDHQQYNDIYYPSFTMVIIYDTVAHDGSGLVASESGLILQ